MPGGRGDGCRGLARRAARAALLALRRGAVRDAAHRAHGRSRNERAQCGHVPHAALRRPHHGHALARAQDRCPALRRLPASGAPHARVGGAGRRSGLCLCRHGAHARQHGRVPSGGFSAPPQRAAGEVSDQRAVGAGRLRLRDRGLCRSGRGVCRGGAVRRPYGILLARRPLPAVPCDGRHAPARRDLARHARGHTAPGGCLDRPGHGAHLPRTDPLRRAARGRGPRDARGGHGAQPGGRLRRAALSGR